MTFCVGWCRAAAEVLEVLVLRFTKERIGMHLFIAPSVGVNQYGLIGKSTHKKKTDLLWNSNIKSTPFRGSRSTMRANQKSSRQQKPTAHIIWLGAIYSSSFTSPETAEAASTATSCCPLKINMKFRCSWPLMKCSLSRYTSLFYFYFLEWHTVIYISNRSCSHSFNSPSRPDEEIWAEKRNLKLQYFNNGVGLHCSVRGFQNLR